MGDRRLSFGAGPVVKEGWSHADRNWYPGYQTDGPYLWDRGEPRDYVGSIANGLPWTRGHFSYAVTNHALQDIEHVALVPALAELRRVTKPGGWLRVLVPDVLAAYLAYLNHDSAYFQIADGLEPTHDGKFACYVTQAGKTRSVFTTRYLSSLLLRAGWSRPTDVEFGQTISPYPEIVDLDSRPAESLIVEAQNA